MQTTNQPSRATGKFRKDINGIRAWAVMAVLLFHFKVVGFEAGFIGVDIFFVISGFLMTGIIAKGLDRGDFSVWKFYIARFRRIVPAVATLVIVLLTVGWFWLPTPDYKSLGTQSFYTMGFLSNIYYWRTAGYFDAVAHEKLLLHTWSLGVEMQFYLLFPIFAAIVWKLKPGLKTFFNAVAFICVLSFILSIALSSWKPVAAFYLIPVRGWELTAGGITYYLAIKQYTTNQKKLFYFLGLALWLIGFVIINNNMPWPSGWALFPVIGTSLLILASQEKSLLMNNPFAQWLGNISYSVYLWHWPLVVALYFTGLINDWNWVGISFLSSFLLGDLSYRLIETPTRNGLVKFNLVKQLSILSLIGVSVGSLSITSRIFDFNNRLDESVQIAANETTNKDPRKEECFTNAKVGANTGCVYGGSKVSAILMGDSHAGAMVTALGDAAGGGG